MYELASGNSPTGSHNARAMPMVRVDGETSARDGGAVGARIQRLRGVRAYLSREAALVGSSKRRRPATVCGICVLPIRFHRADQGDRCPRRREGGRIRWRTGRDFRGRDCGDPDGDGFEVAGTSVAVFEAGRSGAGRAGTAAWGRGRAAAGAEGPPATGDRNRDAATVARGGGGSGYGDAGTGALGGGLDGIQILVGNRAHHAADGASGAPGGKSARPGDRPGRPAGYIGLWRP